MFARYDSHNDYQNKRWRVTHCTMCTEDGEREGFGQRFPRDNGGRFIWSVIEITYRMCEALLIRGGKGGFDMKVVLKPKFYL